MGEPVKALPENNPLIDKWTLEYEQGGIPSSIRTTPSGSVVWGGGGIVAAKPAVAHCRRSRLRQGP